jgi:hypothetical protein
MYMCDLLPGHSEVVMKSLVAKLICTMMLAGSIGVVTGCDISEEKKSVFRPANDTKSDSSNSGETSQPRVDSKKDNKKPRAFSKIDRVAI